LLTDISSFLSNAVRVVVVGVGNEVRGDDAAGVEVLKILQKNLKSESILLLDGGTVPENFTLQIKHFKPSHVILVDATNFEAKPGEVVIAEPSAIKGHSVSTHTIPLSVLSGYLRDQTGAATILVGIQPASVRMGAGMSDCVRISVQKVAETLLEELGSIKGQITSRIDRETQNSSS